MGTIVAVDIGGTHLRAAAYAPETLQPFAQQRIETLAGQPGIFDRLVKVIEAVWPKDGQVDGIGVAAPGPLDPYSGMILDTPNIKEWHNFPLVPDLATRFKVPVFLDNDANLAGLAEWKYGAGQGHHHVLYMTISTGIGGGVIINDRLLQGYHGLAAEVGHMTILPDGPICGCGQAGHLEALASGPAIARYVLGKLKAGVKSSLKPEPGLSARQVAEAAGRGDPLAKSAFDRAGHYLGLAVANLLHIFDPSIVIFGGGVSKAGALLFDPFDASLKKHVLNARYLDGLVITKAALGDDAGLLGALGLAQISLQFVE